MLGQCASLPCLAVRTMIKEPAEQDEPWTFPSKNAPLRMPSTLDTAGDPTDADAFSGVHLINALCDTGFFLNQSKGFSRLRYPSHRSSPKAKHQTKPGISHPPSRLYRSDLRRRAPCEYQALDRLARSPRCVASYPLAVRRTRALPKAPSRFLRAIDTLPLS